MSHESPTILYGISGLLAKNLCICCLPGKCFMAVSMRTLFNAEFTSCSQRVGP